MRLLTVEPSSNVTATQAAEFVERVVSSLGILEPRLEQEAADRSNELELAHDRVRAAARMTGTRTQVEPRLPVDVLGIYVLLPQPRP
jgi:hypothetical protein